MYIMPLDGLNYYFDQQSDLFLTVVDCGDPGIPRNGLRDISSTLFRSIVEYSCYNGYHLIGDNVRFCMASGKWSGFLPTCQRE